MKEPLSGIRVIDMTLAVQGPAASLYLRDMGADVIKVEPPLGDPSRYGRGHANETPAGTLGPQFVAVNRGKRSVSMDLTTELGRKAILALLATATLLSQTTTVDRPPLAGAFIDDLATLLRLEDTRQFDRDALSRIIKSQHAEVRRRAALAIGRIADPAGAALLEAAHADKDPDVAATVLFAAGQLKVPATIPWLEEAMSSPGSLSAVAREAAIAGPASQVPAGEVTKYSKLSSVAGPTRSDIEVSSGSDLCPSPRRPALD